MMRKFFNLTMAAAVLLVLFLLVVPAVRVVMIQEVEQQQMFRQLLITVRLPLPGKEQ